MTVEGHGRDPLTDDTDFAGTVGWFTSEFPVLVPTDAISSRDALIDALSGGTAAGVCCAASRSRSELFRAGVSATACCATYPVAAPEFSDAVGPELLLNYLGRFPSLPGTGWSCPSTTHSLLSNRQQRQCRKCWRSTRLFAKTVTPSWLSSGL